MKLKFGQYTISSAFLMKVAFICFLVGIHIGAYLAARSEGRSFPHIAFMGLYVVVVPMLVRRMKNNIERAL